MVVTSRVRGLFAKAATSVAVRVSQLVDNAVVAAEDKGGGSSLVILDDFFPGVLSAFRIAEYNHYLEKIQDSEVHSTRRSNLFFRSSGSYQHSLEEYGRYHPQFVGRIKKFNSGRRLGCNLVYTVFLNNAYSFIDYIDRNEVPFVFTLYPGGGFYMNNAESDRKLRRVLSSANFKKVIVTQKVTRQYLIDNKLCDPGQIEFIYGCTLNTAQLAAPARKLRYGVDKKTLDICFVAAKYIARGTDKGYDTFIDVAKILSRKYDDVRFHVVGSFDASDIDVAEISDKITFYGLRNTDFFPGFYAGMDMIVSPNVPFVLAPGAFDGFPTASCMEAGLCGVALLCTDPLDLNVAFKDGAEIVIIPNDADEVAKRVSYYHDQSDELYRVAAAGKAALERVLNLEDQMSKRVETIERYLEPRPER